MSLRSGDGRLNDEVRHIIESTFDEVEVDGLGKGRISILKAARFASDLEFGSQQPQTKSLR